MADPAPALKEWFNAARYRSVAEELRKLDRRFDERRFLALALEGLDELSLMQRLRRMSECFRATLSDDFEKAVGVLRQLAPRIDHGFVTLVLPDYVGLYGRAHFDASMDALKFFTRFGSAEFAVREFLRLDLERALKTMHTWSLDACEHVRRLASEGCRPRLPWSFRLERLVADPAPVAPILENLKADPSLYVRKSVANHLNDITKDHPDWVMDRLDQWDRTHTATGWIAKRALRTLIKAGDRRALGLIGAGDEARVRIDGFSVSPEKAQWGERLTFECQIISKSAKPQRLVVDYAIHYVKKAGGTSAKVFKWKEVELAGGAALELSRSQVIKDFTTRVHHPGRHRVVLLVNGAPLAECAFELRR